MMTETYAGACSAPLVNRPYLNAGGTVAVYENSVSIARPRPEGAFTFIPPRQRGAIQSFSAKSRSRLMRLFSRIELSKLHAPLFVTLTYHGGFTLEERRPQEHLNTFLVALRRKDPHTEYIWRMEPQKRGMPHFHVVVFLPKHRPQFELESWQKWVSETWHRIADPTSQAHERYGTHVRQADSFRKAMYYVSKYIGKRDSGGNDGLTGRRWAASRGLPHEPVLTYYVDSSNWYKCRRTLRKLISRRSAAGRRYARSAASRYTLHVVLDVENGLKVISTNRNTYARGSLEPPSNCVLGGVMPTLPSLETAAWVSSRRDLYISLLLEGAEPEWWYKTRRTYQGGQ